MADEESIVTKTIRLPGRLVHEIEERSEFNRFLVDAAEHALALVKAGEIIEAHQAEHGAFTPEQLAYARRAWHDRALAAADRSENPEPNV